MGAPHVLVTGSQGFVGKALVDQLKSKTKFIVDEFDLNDGDIADGIRAHEDTKHVFHLAANSFVPASWKRPTDFYRVNVLGTLNVLEFCRSSGAALTYFSAYVYGRPQSNPISEDHPRVALNPYSQSKIHAEDLCEFYHKNFNVSVTVLRPFNVYGPGQREEFLIPTIVKQAKDVLTSTVEVADLRPRRDFVYIDDLVDAALLTLGKKGFSAFNIGGGVSYSVEDLIQLILQQLKLDKAYRSKNEVRQDEILDLFADISRAKAELGWTPKVSFESGLRRVLGVVEK